MRASATAPNKLQTLEQAVRLHVSPGDTLYFGGSMGRANAALFEVTRQFWGQSPAFILAVAGAVMQYLPLVHGKLVSKIITSFAGSNYPTPAPHPIYMRAESSGEVVFEHWSMMSMVQRLMAAALNLPFFPTNSLIGSDLYRDLEAAGHIARVVDPFGSGDTAVVPPLAPDVTFVHALACDPAGNAIICPPHYDGKWAALAAKRAVVVTAEKIVDQQFIRDHANFVELPSMVVKAVCHTPFGSHPNMMPSMKVEGIGGYVDDDLALRELRAASRSADSLDAWCEQWILGCADHDEYLRRVGRERLHALRGATDPQAWRADLPAFWNKQEGQPLSQSERHVALATRYIMRRLARRDLTAILAGIGVSSLAAWSAAAKLRDTDVDIPLMSEVGMVGYIPSPASPFLFGYPNIVTSSSLSDILVVLGAYTGGGNNQTLGVLGAAQVDKNGNINSSVLKGRRIVGSGGANDIATNAREVIVTVDDVEGRLVDAVEYVTSPGARVSAIVTPNAVFERGSGGIFELAVVMQTSAAASVPDLVTHVRQRCGWDFRVREDLLVEPDANAEELLLARLFDAQEYILAPAN
jgi:acyl CoA:acetate/3-ketoacid CoA transferase alpha subunit